MQTQDKPTKGIQQQRVNSFEFRAVDDNSNQIELSFSSEYPVNRWYGAEILAHDASSVSMTRLLTAGSFLFNHGRDVKYGKMPIGKIEKAWVDESQKKCRALVSFDDDDSSQLVKTKVLSGSIKGVSFGYSVDSWEEVAAGKTSSNGRFTGPAYIGLKWEPYEISIEPTPADPTVGIGRELGEPPRPGAGCNNSIALLENQLKNNKNYL